VQAFSVPSGHAMAAGAVFGILALLAWRELSGRTRWVAVAICIGIGLLIALTRPYLGVHYPTDVIAGLFAGGLWADLVVVAWRASAYGVRSATAKQ
jgi:undecaprenyl-diphosphatase